MRCTIWDLETSDLGASFGRLLCCSFIDLGAEKVETYRRDRRPWKGAKLNDDSKLAVAIRDRLERSDIIMGWNSILFDQPFLNGRLAAAGERPLRASKDFGLSHIDLMYTARGQAMRLGSSRLDSVTKFLHTNNLKTPLTPETWSDATHGDKKAMASVIEHCEQDVLCLRDAFPSLAPFVKKLTFSFSEVWPFIADIPSRHAS